MALDDADQKAEKGAPSYQAPALEKELDIIELLARTGAPLSRADIARNLDRIPSRLAG